MAQRSTPAFLARRQSFFVRRLEFRVGLGDLRPRLAQTKVQLTEKSLALAHLQFHPELLVEKGGQSRPAHILVVRPNSVGLVRNAVSTLAN